MLQIEGGNLGPCLRAMVGDDEDLEVGSGLIVEKLQDSYLPGGAAPCDDDATTHHVHLPRLRRAEKRGERPYNAGLPVDVALHRFSMESFSSGREP